MEIREYTKYNEEEIFNLYAAVGWTAYTENISDMCHKADEPIYVTKNGYGDMVLMSIEYYEATQKQLQIYKDIELSEKQIKEGKTKDARKALSSVREKYGL